MLSSRIPRRTAIAHVTALAALVCAPQLGAQHQHTPPRDSARAIADSTHAAHTMHASRDMAGPLGISMDRMGSGTTWIPDEVTLPSRHIMLDGWRLMLHGFLFGQYDRQFGPRGSDQLGSLNWAMLMADHALAGGRIQLRTMLSLDPATVGRCGYPLLLQSGEMCHDRPLVDRQHPHDFWMELGALYERAVTSSLGVSVYAAPAGEPALSPVAFMHRPSAMDDPTAPLGHHWQDATHITFGVLTLGLFTKRLKLEGSIFNGREPDEHRWNFDPIRFDSYSGRVTFNPTASWSFTAGYGYLEDPEREHPGERLHRIGLSALYGQGLGAQGQWSAALVYGRNAHAGESSSSSVLAEAEAILDRRNTLFGRAELVQKRGENLALSDVDPERRFNVGMVGVGYIREIARGYGATLGLGVRGNIGFVPSALQSAYGSRTPAGAMVFVRLRSIHLGMTPGVASPTGAGQAAFRLRGDSDHENTGDPRP
jgi:hypothetical protein